MSENFNYIAFGDRDYVETAEYIRIGRGRMFEYTPTEAAKGLETFDENTVEFLEKLPTFLCSEIAREEDGVSTAVRYGSIAETRAGRREVTAKFQPLMEFGAVKFENVDQATALFGLGGFQIYRTHWAVRAGNAQAILAALAKRQSEMIADVERLKANAVADTETKPPAQRKNIIGVAASVEDFLEVLEGQPQDPLRENFYRGHENAVFGLTPSLLRKWPNGSWQLMPSENRLFKELLIAHYDEFQGDQYCLDRLVRMQHYGMPTRLLDLSSSPLVALFFGCYCPPDLMSVDGEVISFDSRKMRLNTTTRILSVAFSTCQTSLTNRRTRLTLRMTWQPSTKQMLPKDYCITSRRRRRASKEGSSLMI
jgi:hypothetical protein